MEAKTDAAVARIHAAQLAVGRAAAQIESLAGFFSRMTEAAAELMGARAAAFWLVDADGTTATLQTEAHGIPSTIVESRHISCDPALESVASRLFHRDEMVRGPATAAPDLVPTPALETAGLLAVPWRIGDRRLGALCVYDSTVPGGFSEEDASVLQAVAYSAANVYQRQEVMERLREELDRRERAERRLAQILHIGQMLNSFLDPDQLLATLTLQAMDVIGAEAGWSGLRTPEGLVIQRYFLRGDPLPFEYTWPPGHGAAGWTLIHKLPYLTNNVAADEGATRELYARLGVDRVLCTPIIAAQGEVLGFFELHNKPADFDEDDRELLTALATSAALAAQNAIAYQRLEDLEQAKSDFLNLAAHELRGPVATARGYMTLLEDGEHWSTEQRRQMLGTVTRKLDHIRFLVDQMLTTARLEEHRLPMDEQEFDLCQLVEETARELDFAIRPHHQLTLETGARARIRGDRRRVGTILANLIDNALKYSPDGGEVRVGCSTEVDSGWAQVVVEDHGIGISEANLTRLFTRFGRIVTSDNSHIPGTGLGLYLSRQLALLHGGDITVQSEPGVGSRFNLRLPLAPSKD